MYIYTYIYISRICIVALQKLRARKCVTRTRQKPCRSLSTGVRSATRADHFEPDETIWVLSGIGVSVNFARRHGTLYHQEPPGLTDLANHT